jgi:integrase
LRIRHTKTIQFAQRVLSIPLPVISGSVLCPVAALETHLHLNNVPPSAPLFSVQDTGSATSQPITYPQFARFLAKSVQAAGQDPTGFSPHSFRRGGATFAFDCGIPAELINLVSLPRNDR